MDNCPDYTACVENACSAEYEQCMGAGYKQGDFTGGACADWLDCTTACNCDQACAAACTQSSACTSCLTGTIGNCVFGSNCLGLALACSGNGAGGSGSGGAGSGGAGNGAGGDLGVGGIPGLDGAKTCADLQACCATKSGDAKQTCDSAFMSSQNIDLVCSLAYAQLCP
jgi:hypothetical protein